MIEMIDLCYMQLHDSLFHAGKNFEKKLDPSRLSGLEIKYNQAIKEFYVIYQNRVACLPYTSVFSYEAKYPKEIGFDLPAAPERKVAEVVHHPMRKGIVSAQVQTPMGHVFQGEGAGKTND